MEEQAKNLFNEAIKKLNEANEELYRPEEDIVSYLVCKNAQNAIENYLRGFLLKNGNDPSSHQTIEALYQQCIIINKNFKKVNLADFACKSHNTDLRFCTEISEVSNCINIAENLDAFLRSEKIIR